MSNDPESNVPRHFTEATRPANWAAARAFRRAVSHHVFSGPQGRILDKVLFYGLERGLWRAEFPRQEMLAVLCRLSPGKVSEELGELADLSKDGLRVLERDYLDIGRGRKWLTLAFRPPGEWRAPWRIEEASQGRLAEVEEWLEGLDSAQPDLLPEPASLNDLLRENFAADGQLTPGGCDSRDRESYPGGNFVTEDVEPRGRGGQAKVANVPPEVTFAPSETEKVTPGGTSSDKVTQQGTLKVPPQVTLSGDSTIAGARASRSINRSRDKNSDLDPDRSRSSSEQVPSQGTLTGEFRAYVEQRLFQLIGEHERQGRCNWLWAEGIKTAPEEVNILIATVEDMRRTGRLKTTPARFLNFAVHQELMFKKAKAQL